jgi:hypothetical protein
MDTPRSFATRTPLALLLLAALVPLAACEGVPESAQAAAAENTQAVQQAVEQVESAPMEPVPPVVQPSMQPDAPATDATPSAPAATATAPRPRPTPRPAVPSNPANPGTEPARPVREALFVPEGTMIEATVESELSTERSVIGDRVFATIADDVLGANGAVLIPAGSRINARVAESRASTGPDQPAVLVVEVESIGSGAVALPLMAEVVELESEVQARDSNTETATKVGVGAVAGAIIGRILGDDKKDAAKGAVVGAAAGAAVAVAQRDGQAVVKPGARMVVRLSERLFVEQD